jgi:antitoxin component YwqK of YwqJK toxin-antitoxin module
VGQFTWWYDNGQKQAEGTYDEGLKSGSWTTWHANGMKESVGEYACGENVGRWMRWQADGRLVELHDFGGAAEVSAERQTEEQTQQQVNTDNLESDDAEVSLIPDPWSTKL